MARAAELLADGQREQSGETVTLGVGVTVKTLMSSSSLMGNGCLATGWLRTPRTEHSVSGALPMRLTRTSKPWARSWLMVVEAPPPCSGEIGRASWRERGCQYV